MQQFWCKKITKLRCGEKQRFTVLVQHEATRLFCVSVLWHEWIFVWPSLWFCLFFYLFSYAWGPDCCVPVSEVAGLSVQHLRDPCILCCWTKSLEFTAWSSAWSSCWPEQTRQDLKTYLFAGHSKR